MAFRSPLRGPPSVGAGAPSHPAKLPRTAMGRVRVLFCTHTCLVGPISRKPNYEFQSTHPSIPPLCLSKTNPSSIKRPPRLLHQPLPSPQHDLPVPIPPTPPPPRPIRSPPRAPAWAYLDDDSGGGSEEGWPRLRDQRMMATRDHVAAEPGAV